MCSLALTKSEIATTMQIDVKTLAHYCNERYYEELKEIGYIKTQKKFTPAQVKLLREKLGF
jgi:DNA-binding transcriptional regulator YiaG